MPDNQRASVPSQGRQSRRPSQSGQSSRDGPSALHRRDKTKSSGSYPTHPRRESSKDNAAAQLAANIGATQARRPSLKGRAHSAPLVPKNGAPNPLPQADEEDEAEAGSSFLDADPGDDDDVLEEDEIADDPFFTRFNFPSSSTVATSVRPDEEPPSPDSRDSSTDTEGPLSPTSTQMRARPDSIVEPLGSPLNLRANANWSEPSTPRMEEINIAVLGSTQSGKSTFIQRAFDLRSPPNSQLTQRKMSIDGNVYVVRLVELTFDDLDLDDHKRICWPDTIDRTPVPVIDGAFTLYDVMNRESLVQIPETLSGIYNASIPFILVACKCDVPPSRRHVDPMGVDQRAKALIGDITAFQTSYTQPDSQKRCVAVLLRAIVSVRNPNYFGFTWIDRQRGGHRDHLTGVLEHLHLAAARRRAHSSAVRHVSRHSGGFKHSRAASEFPASMMRGATTAGQEPMSAPSGLTTKSRSQQNLPDAIAEPQRQKPRHHDFDKKPESDDDTFPIQGTTQFQEPLTPEQSTEHVPLSLQPSSTKSSATEIGVTFDDLVDRLLAQPMSKIDTKFQAIFLALYRKFAAPAQLLDAIVTRFEEVGVDDVPTMTKASAQLRQLAILEQWISNYPGDFAYPTTRKALEKYITRIRPIRLYAVAARELQANLDNALEDDDTDWAFCDRAFQRARLAGDGLSEHVVGLAISDERSPPQSPTSGRSASASTSTSSSQTMLIMVESASRQARALIPSARGRGIPLTKIQWRSFMETSDENIARELTRQDWIIFTAIRPRDLVRHVSLSAEEKKKMRGKGLSNVQRMIDHFNHVSYMVVNLVLLRDKPKHRALMLEKIMRVARELRRLNNYNGLGAVLAGLNAVPVHRLAATRELVPQGAAKDFMKLEILMGSAKSHFAYRLAWENTPGERIPYLPLHRRDLVSASEGNRTFVGADSDSEMEARWLEGAAEGSGAGRERWGEVRINWRKFEILGEGVWGVQRAQGVPYGRFPVCEEVRALVVETEIMSDDDALYERSTQIEPASSSGGVSAKKKFQWFQGSGLATTFPSG